MNIIKPNILLCILAFNLHSIAFAQKNATKKYITGSLSYGISIAGNGFISENFANKTKAQQFGQSVQIDLSSNKQFKLVCLNASYKYTFHDAEIFEYAWNNKWTSKNELGFSGDRANGYHNHIVNLGVGIYKNIGNYTIAIFPEAGLAYTVIGDQYETFDVFRSSKTKTLRDNYAGWSSFGIDIGTSLVVQYEITKNVYIKTKGEWLYFNTSEFNFPNSYTSKKIYYRTTNFLIGIGTLL